MGYIIRNGVIYGGGSGGGDSIFHGTQAEWEQLSSAQKASYDFAAFTDDYDPSNITNPNLLDNPWFTVNQRGQSSYSEQNKYSVDRWILGFSDNSGSLLEVDSNGVLFTRESNGWMALIQKLEISRFVLGKPYTMSLLHSDGTIKSTTFTLPSPLPSQTTIAYTETYNKVYARFDYSENGIGINIVSDYDIISNAGIRAIKLELGSQSTLAMDTIPNYASELLKCQRYFVNYPNSAHPLNLVGVGYETGGIFNLPLPCAMRTTPAITILNAGNMFDVNGTALTRTGSFVDAINVNNLRLYLGVSETLPNFKPVTIDQLELSISADL